MAVQNPTLKPVKTEWTQERIKKILYPLLEDIEASHTLLNGETILLSFL